ALSSAAFTAWPLKVRVGENSPSLCPTICSVMYTGMNFLPLWTAIVCPTISGSIVERRDQVFTTFFSFRSFNASTFSRRWLSMNGPFLSERGIFSSYSSTRRNFTHCARRIFRNPLTGPATRCESGQKGHTKRVPCAFGIFSTITAQPALHKRNRTCGAGATFEPVFTTGFTARRGTAFRARAARRGVRRCERRDVLLAVIRLLSNTRRAGFILLLFSYKSSSLKTWATSTTAFAAPQSSGRSAASFASSRPESGNPREFAG